MKNIEKRRNIKESSFKNNPEKNPFTLPATMKLDPFSVAEAEKKSIFIAPGASVLGDITIGQAASFWFSAVARADINHISIGRGSNVQDAAVLHVSNRFPCTIGHFVTIGHGAIVHAASVDEAVLIGMRAVILDGAHIGAGSVIAAGSVVLGGAEVPPQSLMAGVPAKLIRKLPESSYDDNLNWAKKYQNLAAAYLKSMK